MDIKDLLILNLLFGNNKCQCKKSQPKEEMGWGTILLISSPAIWIYRHELILVSFFCSIGFLWWAINDYRGHRLRLIGMVALVVILGLALWMSWGHISGEWADYLKECSVIRPGNQL